MVGINTWSTRTEGLTVRRNLMSMLPLSYDILRSFLECDYPQWTSQLYQLPKVTFSTIYHLIVDRKVYLKKVSYLEEIAEKSPDNSNEEVFQMCAEQSVPIEYTRTLSKAYVFLKMVMCRILNIIFSTKA